MNFWKYKLDINSYSHLDFVDMGTSRRLLGKFMGQPVAEFWTDLKVCYPKDWEAPEWNTEERKLIRAQREGRINGDFTWLVGAEGATVFSDKALQIFKPILGSSIEILPLSCEDYNLHLINVIDVIDCLDQEKSEIKRHSNGSIMRIFKHVFKEEMLTDKHIFKIQPQTAIYVSDLFKMIVEENNLKGLVWEPLL